MLYFYFRVNCGFNFNLAVCFHVPNSDVCEFGVNVTKRFVSSLSSTFFMHGWLFLHHFCLSDICVLVCRQQLEEMAEKLKFPSVHQFAVEILRRDSAQRLAWLRQYYSSLNHPDLANTVTNNFPQPDSAQTSSSASTKTAATRSEVDTRTPQKDVLKAKKRHKYAQKKPETPQNNVFMPQKKPRHPQNDVQEPQKKQKIPRRNVQEPLSDVPSLDSEEQEERVCSARGHKRTKKSSVSSSGAFRAGGGLGSDKASSSGLGSGEAAAFLNRTDRDTPSSADLSHGRSTTLSKPTAQEREQEQKLSSKTSEPFQGQRERPHTPSPPEQAPSTSSRHSFLTDLIGDTSILDDLLKPKSRGEQHRGTPKTPPAASSMSASTSRITLNSDSGSADLLDSLSSPKSHNTLPAQQAASKRSRKDFWDILNEGNEESINRLTDPAEVKRVCISTKFAARSHSGEEESKSLWKTNDKFLWK